MYAVLVSQFVGEECQDELDFLKTLYCHFCDGILCFHVCVTIFYRTHQMGNIYLYLWKFSTDPTTCAIGFSESDAPFADTVAGKRMPTQKSKRCGWLVEMKADQGCGFYYFGTFVRVWRWNVTVWLKLLQCHEWPSFNVFLFMLCAFAVVFATVVFFVLFLFPNERSGRIQYSYCRKVVPAPAGVSHIDDMCRAQGRGDPVWFIQHHQLLVYLPPAYTSAQTKGRISERFVICSQILLDGKKYQV